MNDEGSDNLEFGAVDGVVSSCFFSMSGWVIHTRKRVAQCFPTILPKASSTRTGGPTCFCFVRPQKAFSFSHPILKQNKFTFPHVHGNECKTMFPFSIIFKMIEKNATCTVATNKMGAGEANKNEIFMLWRELLLPCQQQAGGRSVHRLSWVFLG